MANDNIVYRAFSVNHRNLTINHIGDYFNREDAELDLHLDRSDDPSPDKGEFFSWHIHPIYKGIAKLDCNCWYAMNKGAKHINDWHCPKCNDTGVRVR